MPRRQLLSVAERYPVVSHGVGLGIGSTDPLDWDYLRSLRGLIRETNALWASDHLCWNRADGRTSNDLLPLPFSDDARRQERAGVGIQRHREGRLPASTERFERLDRLVGGAWLASVGRRDLWPLPR